MSKPELSWVTALAGMIIAVILLMVALIAIAGLFRLLFLVLGIS